jgi:hypothetical protein
MAGRNAFVTLKTPRTQERLRDVEDAAHVDTVNAVQVSAVGLQERPDVSDAGVVDQNVEPLEPAMHSLARLLALRLVCYIQRDEFGLPGRLRDRGNRFPAPALIAIGNENVRGRRSQGFRNRRPDARAGAGDERDLFFQTEHGRMLNHERSPRESNVLGCSNQTIAFARSGLVVPRLGGRHRRTPSQDK